MLLHEADALEEIAQKGTKQVQWDQENKDD